MKFSSEEFDLFEYKDRLFDMTVDVEFKIEEAQDGGKTDPSWSAYPYIDGQDWVIIKEINEAGDEIELDPKEVIFDEGLDKFIPLADKLAELFVEENTQQMLEKYEEYSSEY